MLLKLFVIGLIGHSAFAKEEDFNRKPQICSFPFTYGGAEYNECTRDGSSFYWCSPKKVYDGAMYICNPQKNRRELKLDNFVPLLTKMEKLEADLKKKLEEKNRAAAQKNTCGCEAELKDVEQIIAGSDVIIKDHERRLEGLERQSRDLASVTLLINDIRKHWTELEKFALSYQSTKVVLKTSLLQRYTKVYKTYTLDCTRKDLCYEFHKVPTIWSSAANNCRTRGFSLVIEEDAEEHAYLYAKSKALRLGRYWVNGNDRKQPNHWLTTENQPLQYIKWHAGKPSNYKTRPNNCVMVGYYNDDSHSDLGCQNKINYICKRIRTSEPNVPPKVTVETQFVSQPKPTLLSLRKRTSQSSTSWGGSPSRGVDGNTSGNYRHRSCTHTGATRNNWWQVDLAETYKITSVNLFNRGDCCTHRLRYIYIQTSVDGRNFRDCAKFQGPGRPNQVVRLGCSASARFVRVNQRAPFNEYLTLCEVQVFGYKPIPPKPVSKNDEHIEAEEVEEEEDVKTNQVRRILKVKNLVIMQLKAGSGVDYVPYMKLQKKSTHRRLPPRNLLSLPFYFNPMAEQWSSLPIQQVRVDLYAKGARKGILVFNGEGATSTNWMSAARLMSAAPWDVKKLKANPYKFFSVLGDAQHGRTMFAIKGYRGCENDIGIMVVSYKANCGWDKAAKYPRISMAVSGDKNFGNFNSQATNIESITVTLSFRHPVPIIRRTSTEIAAETVAKSEPATLLSLRKSTSQSSTAAGGSSSRAVDGNTSGNYYHNSCTHTVATRNNWWQVDLAGTYKITSVNLFNRGDCCTDRLKYIYIQTSVDGRNFKDCAGPGQPSQIVRLHCSATARFVRVNQRAPFNQYLTLCEVQVFGYKPTAETVAKPETAHQRRPVGVRSIKLMYLRNGAGIDFYPYLELKQSTNDRKIPPRDLLKRKFYLNPLVKQWKSLPISQVRVDFYNSQARVGILVFKGTGTTPTNWFSQANLVTSAPWDYNTLKTKKFVFFNLVGKNNQRMMIANLGGCGRDNGVMAIAYGSSCAWEGGRSPKPKIVVAANGKNVGYFQTGSHQLKTEYMIITLIFSSPVALIPAKVVSSVQTVKQYSSGSLKWTRDCTTGKVCYDFHVDKANWNTAKANCEKKGYFLANEWNRNEHNWILKTAKKYGIGYIFWINGNDLNGEGAWVDTKGQKLKFLEWMPGEPNGRRYENCLCDGRYTNGKHNDQSCGQAWPYVCKSTMDVNAF